MRKLFIAILLVLSVSAGYAQTVDKGATGIAREEEPHGDNDKAILLLKSDAEELITLKKNGGFDRWKEDNFRYQFERVFKGPLSRVQRDELRDLTLVLRRNGIYIV